MAGNLFVFPRQIGFDVGVVQPGSKITFTATGTSTLQNTYTDIALTVAHTNPVVADAEGLFAPIYLDPNLPDYRVKYTDSSDVLIYQEDDVPAGQGGDSLTLTGTAPFFDIVESDASTDNTTWRVTANGEQLIFQVANDALALFTNILTIDRTINTVDTINLLPTNLQHNGTPIFSVARIAGSSGAAGLDVTWQNLTGDFTMASVSLTTAMITTGVGAGTWKFKYSLIAQTSDTNDGFGFAINHTGTVGEFVARWSHLTSGEAASNATSRPDTSSTTGAMMEGKHDNELNTLLGSVSEGATVADDDILVILEGIIVITVTGSLELKMQGQTTDTVRLMADSCLELLKIE